jgi:hypothetical protein
MFGSAGTVDISINRARSAVNQYYVKREVARDIHDVRVKQQWHLHKRSIFDRVVGGFGRRW